MRFGVKYWSGWTATTTTPGDGRQSRGIFCELIHLYIQLKFYMLLRIYIEYTGRQIMNVHTAQDELRRPPRVSVSELVVEAGTLLAVALLLLAVFG